MKPPVQRDFIESETENMLMEIYQSLDFLFGITVRDVENEKVKSNSSSDDSILLCDSNEIYRHASNTKKVKTCSELKKAKDGSYTFAMACDQGHLRFSMG